MSEKISISEFARRVGVDEALIRRHIKAERFTDAAVEFDDKGRKKIIWPTAFDEWKAFGGGSDKFRRLQPKSDRPDPVEPDLGPNAPASVKAPASKPDEIEFPNKEASSKRLEYFKAETAALEFAKLKGDLVAKDEVQKQLFNAGAELRKALLTIPDQKIDAIITAKDRVKAHAILFEAIESELRRFTDGNVLNKKEPE